MEKVNNNAKGLVSLAMSAAAGNYGTKTMAGNASSGTSFQKFLSGTNDKNSPKDPVVQNDNRSARDKIMNGDKKKTDNSAKKDKAEDTKPQEKDEKAVEKKKSIFSKEDVRPVDEEVMLGSDIGEDAEVSDVNAEDMAAQMALMVQDAVGNKENPLQEAVSAKEAEVTQKIADITGLSEEEVTNILEEMGVSPLQLSDKEALTDFMQKAFDAESPIDLLNVDGAKDMMMAVTDAAQQAVDELSAEEPDIINQLFEAKLAEKADNKAAERFDRLIGGDMPKADFVPEGDIAQFTAISGAASQENPAMFSQSGNQFSGNNGFAFGGNENSDMAAAAAAVNDNLNEAIENAVLRKEEAPGRTDSAEIIRQIIERIEIRASEARASEMRITLKPDYLGEVSLKIASQNGIITAQFTAESQRVKEIIESNFDMLKDALQSQGIEIGQLEVNVGNSNENPGMFAGSGYYGAGSGSSGSASEAAAEEIAEDVSGYVGEENEVVEANVSYMA